MLSRNVTCYVLQRITTSIMNIGFNYVFVSVYKVNLSTQLLHVVMVKTYSSKVGDTRGALVKFEPEGPIPEPDS